MHRVLSAAAALAVVACDPLVHETFRVRPTAHPTNVAAATHAPDVVAGIGTVAARFGLQSDQRRANTDTRTWRGAVEPNGHSHLYVRATVAAGGQVTVIVGEMYTNRWSARGDSLRRAIADTLLYFGAVAPMK